MGPSFPFIYQGLFFVLNQDCQIVFMSLVSTLYIPQDLLWKEMHFLNPLPFLLFLPKEKDQPFSFLLLSKTENRAVAKMDDSGRLLKLKEPWRFTVLTPPVSSYVRMPSTFQEKASPVLSCHPPTSLPKAFSRAGTQRSTGHEAQKGETSGSPLSQVPSRSWEGPQ